MITALTLVLDAIIVLLVAFTVCAATASRWYSQQATLWLTNPNEARAREANPPRLVRAYQRVTKRYR